MSLQLSICEGAAMCWHKDGLAVSEGDVVDFKGIPGGTQVNHALYAKGMEGIAGTAKWNLQLGADTCVLTFEFDMSAKNGNTGRLYGDANFNKNYFMNPAPQMPAQGENVQLFASIQPYY